MPKVSLPDNSLYKCTNGQKKKKSRGRLKEVAQRNKVLNQKFDLRIRKSRLPTQRALLVFGWSFLLLLLLLLSLEARRPPGWSLRHGCQIFIYKGIPLIKKLCLINCWKRNLKSNAAKEKNHY